MNAKNIYEVTHKDGTHLGIYRVNEGELPFEIDENYFGMPIFKNEIKYRGENYENLQIKKWSVQEYLNSDKLLADEFRFSVWSSSKYHAPVHRELVADDLCHAFYSTLQKSYSEIDDEFRHIYIINETLRQVLETTKKHSQKALEYLEDLTFIGDSKEAFDLLEYVSSDKLTSLWIGAYYHRCSLAFDPIPASEWIEWYRQNLQSIDAKSFEERDMYEFIQYPFSGIDLESGHELA